MVKAHQMFLLAALSVAQNVAATSHQHCTVAKCCTADANKCAAWTGSCPANKYKDASKNNQATTAGSEATTCCTAQVQCSTMSAASCGPGHEKDTTKDSTYCPSTGCTPATCCKATANKCAAWTGNCGANKWKKNLATTGSDDATCCVAQQQCSAFTTTCPAGYMKDTAKDTTYCATDACSSSECCKKDHTKCAAWIGGTCAGQAGGPCTCLPGKDYWDHSKAGLTKTEMNCCSPIPTCLAIGSVCGPNSGYTVITNAAATACWEVTAPVASGALRGTPLSVAMVGAAATIVALM